MVDKSNLTDSNMPEQDPYENFRNLLTAHEAFPGPYTFKFIIKNDEALMAQIKEVFKHESPNFGTKQSSNGNYLTLSVQIFVHDAEMVISYYRVVGQIKGVMMM